MPEGFENADGVSMEQVDTASRLLASRQTIARRLRRLFASLRQERREPAKEATAPLLALLALGAVATLLSFPVDERLAYAARDEPDGVYALLSVVTDVGLIAWYFYPALVLALASLVLADARNAPRIAAWRRLGLHAGFLAASLGAASTLTHSIKYALGRARPEGLETYGAFDTAFLRLGSAYESFPSGHSTNVGVLTIVLAIWCPALRWPLFVIGLCLGLTRVAVGAHFPSDVAAGLTIGALVALLFARRLALRHILYTVEHGGCGWSGLLPRRVSASDRPR